MPIHLLAVVLLLAACAGSSLSQAVDPRSETARERLAQVGEGKPAVEARYREALALLDLIDDARQREAEFRAAQDDAARQLATIREELSTPIPPAPEPQVSALPTEEIAAAHDRVSVALAQARDELAAISAEAERRQVRRVEITERLKQLDIEQNTVATLREAVDPDQDAELKAAEVFVADIRRDSIAAERAALAAELESYDARLELLPARRDLAARHVQESEMALGVWQQSLATAREQDANRAARSTQSDLRRIVADHPELGGFADTIRTIAERLTLVEDAERRLNGTADQLAHAEGELDALRSQYRAVRRRMDASGLNRATGLLLRRQYQSLPEIRLINQRVRSIDRALEDTELSLVELQEERELAGDLDAIVEGAVQGIAASDELRAAAREMAIIKRDLLDRKIAATLDRQQTLARLSSVSRELLSASEAYTEFVRERILWVRSISAGQQPSMTDVIETVNFFADGSAWRLSATNAWRELLRRPFVPGALLMLAAALFVLRRSSAGIRQRIAERVRRFRTDAVHLSFLSLGLACLAGAAPSLLLWTVGRVLTSPVEQPMLGIAVGTALQTTATVLFPLMVVRELLAVNGLAEAHFRWPDKALLLLRRNVTIFVLIALPAVAVTVAIDVWGSDPALHTVGRVGFTVALLATTWFVVATLRPTGAVIGPWLREQPRSWASRLSRVWFTALVAVPILLAVLAWLGYFYTAVQLQNRIRLTGVVIVVLVLTNAMLNRWLFVARRRVAYEDARRRREQALKEQAESVDGDGPTEVAPIDEMKIDIPAISEQTRQLFRTAMLIGAAASLFAVWSTVLPALRQLDRVQLYPTVQYLDATDTDVIPELERGRAVASTPPATRDASREEQPGSETTSGITPPIGLAGGNGSNAESERLAAISLADVGLSLVILLLTYVAFRNLPAVFEILLLQRLPLDAGSRYAISTVLRYAISIVGVSLAATALHLSWSNIQWLAAALTFGLAFGLQEIFANFVSGLIILAERPIRLGDTVTVAGVSGTVTNIKMRATTITDWDRKELIIPNRSFITDQVINWTLSDPILRLSIPVGVGYGEDIRLAEKTLLRVAAEQPIVLETPKPHVMFGGFGDSTLDFQLRVFIPNIEQLIVVRHDMHMRITEAFRQEGIEIAFPQRDLHIRTMPDMRGVERVAEQS